MWGAQPLTQGMTGHQLTQLAGQQAVLTQRQPGLGLIFHRGQPLLLQPGDRGLGEQGVGEVRQWRAPPHPPGVCPPPAPPPRSPPPPPPPPPGPLTPPPPP